MAAILAAEQKIIQREYEAKVQADIAREERDLAKKEEAKKKIAEDNGKLLASKANAEMARIDNAKTQARKQALKTHQSQLREQIQVVNSAKAEINMTAEERALNQDRLGRLASMPDQQVFELLKDMPTKSPTKK